MVGMESQSNEPYGDGLHQSCFPRVLESHDGDFQFFVEELAFDPVKDLIEQTHHLLFIQTFITSSQPSYKHFRCQSRFYSLNYLSQEIKNQNYSYYFIEEKEQMSQANYLDRLKSIREKYGCSTPNDHKMNVSTHSKGNSHLDYSPVSSLSYGQKHDDLGERSKYAPKYGENPQIQRSTMSTHKKPTYEGANLYNEDRLKDFDRSRESYKGLSSSPHPPQRHLHSTGLFAQKRETEKLAPFVPPFQKERTKTTANYDRISELDTRISEKEKLLNIRIAENERKLKESSNIYNLDVKADRASSKMGGDYQKKMSYSRQVITSSPLSLSKMRTNRDKENSYASDLLSKKMVGADPILNKIRIEELPSSSKRYEMSPVKLLERRDTESWIAKKETVSSSADNFASKMEGGNWNLGNLDRIQQRIQSVLNNQNR